MFINPSRFPKEDRQWIEMKDLHQSLYSYGRVKLFELEAGMEYSL